MTRPIEWQKDFVALSVAAKGFHITPRRLLGIINKHHLTVIRLGWRVLVPFRTLEQIKEIGTAPYEPRIKPKPPADDRQLSLLDRPRFADIWDKPFKHEAK